MKPPRLAEAIKFIKRAHKGQKDLGGQPYWKHPFRVMARLGRAAPMVEKHAALLHDVLEDTQTTVADLRGAGFTEDVLEAVRLLTRPSRLTYRQYVRRLIASGNVPALRVKLADLLDNMDARRAIPDGKLHARALARHRDAEKTIRGCLPRRHHL